MTTIVTIQSSDQISNSRADLNTNFANLNSDKIETSYLDTDTTLAANSDTKIATQKAVKAYVDAGGNTNASTTQRGIVEQATSAEIIARTTTGGTGAPLFINPGDISSLFTTVVNNYYTTPATVFGDSTTQFDITNPAGTTFRYTFDGTGTDPGITSGTIPTGSALDIQAQNFSSGNKGVFIVTGSGSNYFEVTNVSGVAETNKTIGTGYIQKGTTWTKPSGLAYIEVEMVGGGASGGGCGASTDRASSAGGAGAYLKKKITAASLSSTEPVIVGNKGAAPTAGDNDGNSATASTFSTTLRAGGGVKGLKGSSLGVTNTGGAGGTATGGDINISGEEGGDSLAISTSAYLAGKGGDSPLGFGFGGKQGLASGATTSVVDDGSGYGSGGSGVAQDTSTSNLAGGAGKDGIIIVREYYV